MGTTEQISEAPHNNEKFIDIERIFASKNSRIIKLLPRFVIRYLRKIIHEESLNMHLEKYKDVYGLDFINATLQHFGVKISIHGIDHIRTDEKLLIASNHPLGGLDGMALMSAVGQVNRNLIFPVNDLLLNVKNLRDMFIPINKHGSNPRVAVKLLDEMLISDKIVLYFPAGLVSRKRKGKICDLEWKKTFVTKSRKFKRKIVPVYINGENSKFFYNLANFRKLLGIKANIEMLYLVNEMYNQYNKEINIYFGQPLSFEDLPKDMNDEELAAYIKNIAYKLPHEAAKSDDYIKQKLIFKLNSSDHATLA